MMMVSLAEWKMIDLKQTLLFADDTAILRESHCSNEANTVYFKMQLSGYARVG